MYSGSVGSLSISSDVWTFDAKITQGISVTDRGSQFLPLQAAPMFCLPAVPPFISFRTYISGIIVYDVKLSVGT